MVRRLTIQVKRVYDPPARADGRRFLVDRLWPRGISKSALRADAWLRDVAPSNTLRHWFAHDPVKWPVFIRRYSAELNAHPQVWQPLLEAARRGPVTLLFSTRNTDHNNAIALRIYLLAKVRTSRRRPGRTPAGRTRRRIRD